MQSIYLMNIRKLPEVKGSKKELCLRQELKADSIKKVLASNSF